ncbi:hypothetical protein HN873_071174, partial [Arachis hypogaea]
MSEPEGGEEEDRDESTSERTESERGSLPQRRYSRRHRHRVSSVPFSIPRVRMQLSPLKSSAAISPDLFFRFRSMLAGLESLPEAYQQRMASMMEQVQIRDSMKGIFIALLVLACMAFLQLERSNQSKRNFDFLRNTIADHLVVITIFCFCCEIFADDSRDWFVRFPVIVAAIGSGKPHNRAVARKIQNMGWRADGGLWLLVRGGGLYLSKGTGLTEEFEEVPVQSRGFDSSKHNKELK